MSDIKFRTKAVSLNPTKTQVKARHFEIIVDEPQDLGGTNEGANPVEYLLASYAGCLNVMGHMVAKELDFELKGMEIDLAGSLNPARLFGQATEERAGYKEIQVTLKPQCDTDEQTLQKWQAAILDRCPVGDNLKNTTEVVVDRKKIDPVEA
ncbi:MAG TPA: OsmC family protein [Bacteroidales bacterium]|nr:OsmC family protein [Bacteroidales bacterium]